MKTIKIEHNGEVLCATELNPSTAKAKNWLFSYLSAKAYSLSDAYSNPSKKKISAWEEIEDEMRLMGGSSLRITGSNAYLFSCAYHVLDDSGVSWLIYHTPNERFAIRS